MFSKLKSIFKRCSQNPDYFGRIKTFMENNYEQELNKRKMYEIMEYYEKWITYKKVKVITSEGEVLLYILLKACSSNFDDSNYIAQLLHHLYKVNTDFWFSLSLPTPFPIRSEDPMIITEYILKHTNRNRFRVHGMQITDILLSKIEYTRLCYSDFVRYLGSPAMFQMFLRYGALTTDYSLSRLHILNIVKFLIKYMYFLGHSESVWSNINRDSLLEYAEIIMRVSPQLTKEFIFSPRVSSFEHSIETWKWVIDNILPVLEYRVFKPTPLKHICRLKIRKVLQNKWLLPNGIPKLPIPNLMKDYLDINSD